jgi:hypothetical protein
MNTSLSGNNDQSQFGKKEIIFVFISAFIIGLLFLYWLIYKISPDYWPIGVDIYPRWVGIRAFWNGLSPYSASVDIKTQTLIYGRPAIYGEDSFGFYYPAYIAVILAPLALLPVEIAAIIWSSFMLAIFVSIVVTLTLSLPNRPSPIVWAFLLLSSLLYRPALLSILNGQYGIFILGCWTLAYWMAWRDRSIIAGFLIALSIIKPSLTLFPVLLILFWALSTGQARIAFGFFLALSIMFTISLVQIGWWVPDFISKLGEYSRVLGTWSNRDVLTIPGMLWLLLSMLLIVIGFIESTAEKLLSSNLFFGTLFFNLSVTPHTLEYDLVVLILPLLLLSPILSKSKLGYSFHLFLLWVPWVSWFLFTIIGIPVEIWWKAIWRFYPQLILVTLIIVAIYARKRSIQSSHTSIPICMNRDPSID